MATFETAIKRRTASFTSSTLTSTGSAGTLTTLQSHVVMSVCFSGSFSGKYEGGEVRGVQKRATTIVKPYKIEIEGGCIHIFLHNYNTLDSCSLFQILDLDAISHIITLLL